MLAGDVAIVGPALSALDAQLAFQDPRNAVNPKEAKRNAAHYAAAQEARSMLGQLPNSFRLPISMKGVPAAGPLWHH